MRLRTLSAAGALGALLLPAAADAATKTVFRGPPPKGMLKVQGPAADANFYPKRVSLAAGDKLRIKTVGFGDTIFVPKGQAVPPFAVANPDAPVSGAKDAAGADLWFNGRPALAPNPAVIMPSGGKVIDGSKVVGSGIALDGPAKPWVVRFPKPGVYTLRSGIHPGISLRVNVKPNGNGGGETVAGSSQVTGAGGGSSDTTEDRRIARQLRANTKLAKRLLASKGPKGNKILAGNDAKGIATLDFFPAKKTVNVGDTVTFAMSKSSIETHNVAFGPRPYLDEHAKRFFGPVLEPFVTFRSEAPGTPISFDGANHGNGFVNTGLMDANAATKDVPSSEKITFTKAGTYAYYCAVHGNDMKGQITVE